MIDVIVSICMLLYETDYANQLMASFIYKYSNILVLLKLNAEYRKDLY